MACALPVIGSNSGAIPGVIGNAGLIFPEGNVAALAKHLYDLQTKADLRELFGQQGRKRFLERFTHEKIAKATVAVYKEIMANHDK